MTDIHERKGSHRESRRLVARGRDFDLRVSGYGAFFILADRDSIIFVMGCAKVHAGGLSRSARARYGREEIHFSFRAVSTRRHMAAVIPRCRPPWRPRTTRQIEAS